MVKTLKKTKTKQKNLCNDIQVFVSDDAGHFNNPILFQIQARHLKEKDKRKI